MSDDIELTGTAEQDSISKPKDDNLITCSTGALLFYGFVCCGLITGVGLIAYYVPERTCAVEFEPTEPPISTPISTTHPVTEEPRSTTPTNPPTGSPSPTAEVIWDGRLDPANVLPRSYDLTLQPCLYYECGEDMRFRFYGWVNIVIEVPFQDTSEVIMHMKDIDIVSIKVTTLVGDDTDLYGGHGNNTDYDFLIIDTKEPLKRGTDYRISIEYIGMLQDGLAGFYRSSYTNAAGETVWLATSQMQPTDARRALPCWDEPGFRSYFDTTIIHRENMTALSNGIELSTIPYEEGWDMTAFKTTPKMPTYLLAFVVSDFEYIEETTDNGVRFRVYCRPDAIDSATYGLDQGVKILTYFEEYFATPFPMDKQDMVAIPDFAAGAMENWGLILYRETALLYNKNENSESNKQRVAVVVSHELAHQWFGNLVTPEWWDDLWLNEGFATYVEYLGVDFTETDWQMLKQFVVDDLQDVFTLDALGSSHPVKVPVNSPAEISEIFDTISYAKGGSVLRMLNNILSEDVFRDGLFRYLTQYSEGNANSDKLWDAFNQVQDSYDVKKIMDTWTLQMGYPVINVIRNGNTLTATQEHFLINPASEIDDKFGDLGYLWYCQLTYTHEGEQKYENPSFVWMNATEGKTVTIDLTGSYTDGNWYLINIKQYNYYRVNYDTETWANLAQQLVDDHTVMPTENRAALIDDAFNLARSGSIEYDIPLDMTMYLADELEYVPWEATLTVFRYIRDMFSRNSGYGDLEKYMLCQIQSLYDSVGFEEEPSDTHLDHYNRVNAINTACFYGNKDCLNNTKREYREYMEDGEKVSPNIRSQVYCNGIREGGAAEWDFGLQKYIESTDSAEKSKWLLALSCSREPWILNRYLNYMLDTDVVRKQDASYVIRYTSRNYVGRALAWDFLRSEWDAIFEYFGGGSFSFSSIIGDVTAQFNTEFDLEELETFGEGRDFGSASRAYDQAIDQTKINIEWMEKNADNVAVNLAASLGDLNCD